MSQQALMAQSNRFFYFQIAVIMVCLLIAFDFFAGQMRSRIEQAILKSETHELKLLYDEWKKSGLSPEAFLNEFNNDKEQTLEAASDADVSYNTRTLFLYKNPPLHAGGQLRITIDGTIIWERTLLTKNEK